MSISAAQPKTPPVNYKPNTSNALDSGAGSAKASQGGSLDMSNSGKIISTSTREGLLKLGMMAFGKSDIDKWTNKGLDVSEESLITAAKALQDGFKQIVDKQGTQTAGSRVSINKHQVVINQQQVPEWFIKEYDSALAIIGDPAHQQAFRQGALFFASPPVATNQESMIYQSIASYR
jgi:hypothetical protein